MTDNKLDAQIEANIVVITLLVAVLCIIAGWKWQEIFSYEAPTLIDEPCLPAQPVIVAGKRVGCTDDVSSGERWYPGIKSHE